MIPKPLLCYICGGWQHFSHSTFTTLVGHVELSPSHGHTRAARPITSLIIRAAITRIQTYNISTCYDYTHWLLLCHGSTRRSVSLITAIFTSSSTKLGTFSKMPGRSCNTQTKTQCYRKCCEYFTHRLAYLIGNNLLTPKSVFCYVIQTGPQAIFQINHSY